MALNTYNINFRTLVGQVLGALLNKTVRLAWLTAVAKPLRDLHTKFLDFTALKEYEVQWNGQTIILEKLLQDKFGPGIFITNNSEQLDSLTIGDGADAGGGIGDTPDVEYFIGAVYTPAPTSFTVNVPAAIVFVEAEMEAWINRYKLFGTTYNIIVI